MPTFGAAAVVISEGKVLLIKRRDCEAWALPGGNVEAGETVAETSVREVREETGIEIELTRLVGIYASPQWLSGGNHSVVFAARPLSQRITPQPEEVIESGYSCANQLPEPFVWWHRRWIGDSMKGVCGTVCLQDRIWPREAGVNRRELRRVFQESGMSPQEFFQKYLTRTGAERERVLVEPGGGVPGV